MTRRWVRLEPGRKENLLAAMELDPRTAFVAAYWSK